MKLKDTVKHIRGSRLYRYLMYLIPPLYLLELYIWVRVFVAAMILVPLLIGVFMIPTFPVGARDVK